MMVNYASIGNKNIMKYIQIKNALFCALTMITSLNSNAMGLYVSAPKKVCCVCSDSTNKNTRDFILIQYHFEKLRKDDFHEQFFFGTKTEYVAKKLKDMFLSLEDPFKYKFLITILDEILNGENKLIVMSNLDKYMISGKDYKEPENFDWAKIKIVKSLVDSWVPTSITNCAPSAEYNCALEQIEKLTKNKK